MEQTKITIAEKKLSGSSELRSVNAFDILDQDINFLNQFQSRIGSKHNAQLGSKKGTKESAVVESQMLHNIEIMTELLSKAVLWDEDVYSPLQYGMLKDNYDITIIVEPKDKVS
jgi:hypothetical protein